MKLRSLAYLYTPEAERLSYPPDCPFKTERASLTRKRLLSFGLLDAVDRAEVPFQKATRAELLEFHASRYLDELERAASGDLTAEGYAMGLGGPDTPVFPHMLEYGAYACGAGLAGADLLLRGDADVVFNLFGGLHHAMRERAGGFCYLNDVVLACMRLASAGKRVACVDLDAHHGDGTQAAFYDRDDVLTVSLHETGNTLFPWSGFEDELGAGRGRGYNVNVPLPAETYDAAFLDAFDRIALPVIERFSPDVIVAELGMDILAGDPLTHLRMTNNVVVEISERLMSTGLPLLIAGGGGYHVDNTVRAWALAWRTFCGGNDDLDFGLGLGGVMLGSSEWAGGLRDRCLPVSTEQRCRVEPELEKTLQKLHQALFRRNGSEPVSGMRQFQQEGSTHNKGQTQ